MTERRSDGVSGNGGSGRNIGGRFGRDRMRFGLNGKEMEWNMVHDKHAEGDDDYNEKSDFDRPVMVEDAYWRVYEVVSASADEFNGKIKKMWAY